MLVIYIIEFEILSLLFERLSGYFHSLWTTRQHQNFKKIIYIAYKANFWALSEC